MGAGGGGGGGKVGKGRAEKSMHAYILCIFCFILTRILFEMINLLL